MKKITTNNIIKRLSQYGALSFAIAGISEANGQIIYTDVAPDIGGAGNTYALDLNGDAIDDFRIAGNFLPPPNSASASVGINIYSTNAASFIGSQSVYAYPFALNNGDVISSGQSLWIGDAIGNMNFASCTGSNSNWCNLTDKYLGLRVNVTNGPGPGDDETFYGWARLDVDASGVNWVIKDYAYNSVAGASIMAGQTLSDNDVNFTSQVKIVALNKTIGLYYLPQETSYTVYNISGQKVLNDTTSKTSLTVEVATLASGIYVIELEDVNTNAMIRKKVVL